MRSNTYIFAFLLFCMSGLFVSAQEAELRFDTHLDCSTANYCVTVQVRASDAIGFEMGTSSIFFEYNKEALKFKSYESLNFDKQNKCIAGQFSPYQAHQYDASSAGYFNTTVTIDITEAACPQITDEWIDVAEINFGVIDSRKKVKLRFVPKHTNFNIAKESVELIETVSYHNRLNQIASCNEFRTEDLNDASIMMRLANNPIESTADVNIISIADDVVELALFDITGKKLYEQRVEVIENTNKIVSIDLGSLTNGLYIIKNVNNPSTNEIKLVKR